MHHPPLRSVALGLALGVAGLCAIPAGAVQDGAAAAEPHGFVIGDSGFVAGGYVVGQAGAYRNADPAASLRSLSLLLSWQGSGRWSAFGELEAENLLSHNAGALEDDKNVELVLERLHVDYAWSDALQLRLGKFLTPVGRWNVIHAAPLTWTTSRPLITDHSFPTNVTGGMAHGILPVGGRALEWALYASPGEELAPEDGSERFRRAYGVRVDYPLGLGLQVGSSFLKFEQDQQPGDHKTLYGLDFLWQYRRFELSGEWAWRSQGRTDFGTDGRGSYVQAVVPLTQTLYGVVRHESFEPAGAGRDLDLAIGGLAWRFQPGWVGKIEYRHATENALRVPDGWLGSVAVLF